MNNMSMRRRTSVTRMCGLLIIEYGCAFSIISIIQRYTKLALNYNNIWFKLLVLNSTSQTANVGGDRMNPGIKILPLRPSRRADKRVGDRVTSCLMMWNFLWRRHEYVERKREHYHIIFSERTWRLYTKKETEKWTL